MLMQAQRWRRRYRSDPFASRNYKEVGGQHHATANLPLETPSIPCIGCWVGLGTGLEDKEYLASHQDSIPGPSNP